MSEKAQASQAGLFTFASRGFYAKKLNLGSERIFGKDIINFTPSNYSKNCNTLRILHIKGAKRVVTLKKAN